jgi:hypothetical protein
MLVFLRLFERWRVTPQVVSHQVSILGQKLSYPAANIAAVIVLGLAALGAVVVVVAVVGAIRELRGARRFARHLALGRPLAANDAIVIDDDRPEAFCAGLLRPRVYVTTGALALLDREALEAVLAHERHHAHRRDPLRLATSRVLARAMFFLPSVSKLGRQRQILAEISADESAIQASPANRPALARAMLNFSESDASDGRVRLDPERVDHLLGEPPSWRFPTLVFLGAAFLLTLLGATAALAGQEATGAASLAPPFLSAQPCVVVLALLPAGIAVGAIGVLRGRRHGS